MTPEQERARIEAAYSALEMRRDRDGDSDHDIARCVLAAADRAVPVVSEEEAEKIREGGWHAGKLEGEEERWSLTVRLTYAEEAARAFANALDDIVEARYMAPGKVASSMLAQYPGWLFESEDEPHA